MSTTSGGFPEWAHLPSLALHLISQHLNSVTDYIRFRAVCSPWRSASLPQPCSPISPLQAPWLMIPTAHPDDTGMRLFYDLRESKTHRLHLPETIGMAYCASYHGRLLLVAPGGSQLFLLNPLTRARIDLPPFTTPVTRIWAEPGDPPFDVRYLFRPVITGDFAITKVIFSSALTDPDCIVTVFLKRAQWIFFCRVGDLCWTAVKPPVPGADPADATYHDGTFYFLTKRSLLGYRLSKPNMPWTYFFKPELRDVSKFFLVGKPGLQLVASPDLIGQEDKLEDENARRASKPVVEMYRIRDDHGRAEVERVTDTSDTTIFYGDNCHFLAVCADIFDYLDAGTIYIEKAVESKPCYVIFSSNFNDFEPRLLPVDLGEHPQINSPDAPAMWFQPSFV